MEFMETSVPESSADGEADPTSLEDSLQTDYLNGYEGNYIL
jgi:hypothetical protein